MQRAQGVDVGDHDVEPREPLQQREALARRHPAPGRGEDAGGARGVEEVHVPAQVHRAAGEAVMDVRQQPIDAHAVDLGAGDEPEALVAGVLEHRAVGHGAARPDVQRAGGVDEPFLRGPG